MKLYYTGAQSSGKTTLARYTSEKYKLPLLPETARLVLSERELQIDSLRADIDLVDSYQTEVFYRQIEEEKKYQSFVSDRSLLDSLTYSCQHSRIGAKLASEPILKHYIEELKSQIVFFVRPNKMTVKNDGVRESVDWEGIISIDAQIKLLLELYGIRYFQIHTSSAQERIRQIDAILSLVLK
jgi:nicotinamide riboside kinase